MVMMSPQQLVLQGHSSPSRQCTVAWLEGQVAFAPGRQVPPRLVVRQHVFECRSHAPASSPHWGAVYAASVVEASATGHPSGASPEESTAELASSPPLLDAPPLEEPESGGGGCSRFPVGTGPPPLVTTVT
jgi:hypothetical protein